MRGSSTSDSWSVGSAGWIVWVILLACLCTVLTSGCHAPEKEASIEQPREATVTPPEISDPRLQAALEKALGQPVESATPEVLAGVRKLNLRQSLITNLQGLEVFTGLEEIDLSDNRLSTVEELGQLPSLRCLNLEGNELETFPELEFPRLEILHLGGNQFEVFSGSDLPNLTYLGLSMNPLVQVPDVSGMKSLRALRLAYTKINKIAELEALADEHGARVGSTPSDEEFLTVSVRATPLAATLFEKSGPELLREVGYSSVEKLLGSFRARGVWLQIERVESAGYSYCN